MLLLTWFASTNAQELPPPNYGSSSESPYGRPNPQAPEQLGDYAPLIGTSKCNSISLRPDRTWDDPVSMTWTFKYIMNGMAIQDETIKEDGEHSGSIRQFSQDSSKWYVYYYSTSKITSVSTYSGVKINDDMVLYKSVSDITTPDNKRLYYRLTFSNISDQSFDWRGEWVDPSIEPDSVYAATWKISCIKRK